MGIALGIGGVLVGVTGFSALADNSGFDAYKVAWNNTKAATSLTAHVNLDVSDNGTNVLAARAEMKVNHEWDAGSLAATFGDKTRIHSLQVYRGNGKVVFKQGDSDIYRVMERPGRETKQAVSDRNPPVAVEQVLQVLLGNLRENSTVQNLPDGAKRATLHLSKEEVPAIANVMGSAIFWKLAAHEEKTPTANGFRLELPKLKADIQVEQIHLSAKISKENRIEQQTAVFDITGKDDAGHSHEVTIDRKSVV